MNKWIAKFDLEDGDTMPEHMDLEYKGTKIDFHCKPLEQEPCEDCISRKAVHDMLENLPVTVENKWFNWLQMACMRLAELPSVTPQEPTWIPVSERLPEELLGVLVYCPTYDNIYCAYLEKGEWKIFSKQADEKINEVVVAWQSLPEHYKMVEPQESENA